MNDLHYKIYTILCIYLSVHRRYYSLYCKQNYSNNKSADRHPFDTWIRSGIAQLSRSLLLNYLLIPRVR